MLNGPEPTLANPPSGTRIQELYDLDRMTANDEWYTTYQEVVTWFKQWKFPLR